MRIVLAPDSYKGSLSALEVASYMEEAILALMPKADIQKVPMADGGEGTVDAILTGVRGKKLFVAVTGPLGEPVKAFYGLLPDGSGVLEMAAASGLTLVPPEKRNPLYTTTYGTGELIKEALDRGCRRIILGIGGSATNDGGMGMAQALGVRFLDAKGRELGFGGSELKKLHSLDTRGLDPRIKETEILVACDVDNPLIGPRGAATVFGPQKGATITIIMELEEALDRLGMVILQELGQDIRYLSGAGAAGGLGGGLLVFLGARLVPGFELIAEATGLEAKITAADLVITGEGCTDSQTGHGKTPMGVGKLARKYNVPVIAISGSLEGDLTSLYEAGLDGVFSIIPGPMSLDVAMNRTPELVRMATSNLIRFWQKSKEVNK